MSEEELKVMLMAQEIYNEGNKEQTKKVAAVMRMASIWLYGMIEEDGE